MYCFFSVAWAASLPAFPARDAVIHSVLADPAAGIAAAGSVLAEAGRLRGEATLAPVLLSAEWAPFAHHGVAVDARASWMLPGARMRRSAQEAAAGADRMAGLDSAMAEVQLAARTSLTFDEAWTVLHAVHVLDHHGETVAEAAASVARRVGAGLLRADQRVMAEMEGVLVAEERLVWAGRARRAAADLVAVGGANGHAADLGVLLEAAAVRLEGGAEAWSVGVPADPGPVLVGARAAEPLPVAAAQADAAMAAGMAEMARAEGRPMAGLMAGASSMWEDPGMAVMVGVEVEVPLDAAANAARRAGAEARVRAAAASEARSRAESRGEEARAEAMVHEAERMELLMQERMAPLAAERARLARLAFETGAGTLESWLLAERDLAHARLRQMELRAERRSAEAMLAMARGQRAGIPSEAE